MNWLALVFIPDTGDVKEDVGKILAPFKEDAERGGLWDRWQIGAAYDGWTLDGVNVAELPYSGPLPDDVTYVVTSDGVVHCDVIGAEDMNVGPAVSMLELGRYLGALLCEPEGRVVAVHIHR